LASKQELRDEAVDHLICDLWVALSNFGVGERETEFAKNGLADVKRYGTLFDQPEGVSSGPRGSDYGLQEDVAIEDHIWTTGTHRSDSLVLPGGLLSPIEQIVQVVVTHRVEAPPDGLENLVERLVVGVNEILEVLLGGLSRGAGLVRDGLEMGLIERDGGVHDRTVLKTVPSPMSLPIDLN
jgi:hypothetical protein